MVIHTLRRMDFLLYLVAIHLALDALPRGGDLKSGEKLAQPGRRRRNPRVILALLILHQLPSNIRLEQARVGEEHEGDLDFLLMFLYDEIQRRERSLIAGCRSAICQQATSRERGCDLRGSYSWKEKNTGRLQRCYKVGSKLRFHVCFVMGLTI
ncbi:hypothetical protein PoB_004436800 [Plakobranchus ocellatus]|uniref:Secreted protein n=1 Tax=Plakobranchus ocellatus TaxID=259542 RepID=A0AAV4BG92_9GAST|nr:hypothetical protein PoB_004436800 [Plakobranchus ocellatus]